MLPLVRPYRLPSLLTSEGRDAVREEALRWLTGTIAGGGRECTLDGALVEAVDASGLGLLLLLEKRARESGARLTLERPSPALRAVLASAGLEHAFVGAPD